MADPTNHSGMQSFTDIWMQNAWSAEMPYLLSFATVLLIALLHFSPADRRSCLNTYLLLIAAFAIQTFAALLVWQGIDRAADLIEEIGTILFGLALIRLFGIFLLHVLLPIIHINPVQIIEDLLLTAVYVAWLFVRMRYAGLDLSSLLATSAVITAVLAFSMQDTLGNILGGMALQLDNSIQLDDWIKVDDLVGRVVMIRWRFTAIETRNWETVVIPNSTLMKGKFVVLGRREGQPVQWRRWVWFNVPFEHSPAKVIRVVERAIRAISKPEISRTPLPNCVFMDFDRGYGRYAMRYWLTDLFKDDPTDSVVRNHIYAALKRSQIDLAIPEYQLNVTKHTEKREQAMLERDLASRLDVVQTMELFRTLTPQEMETVAGRLVYAPYAEGDVITRQGDIANWLYILTSGEADVILEKSQHAPSRLLTTLKEGSVFGEMGLMTGEKRSATVTARTEAECYRLDKVAFEDILKARPELAEEISTILATRQDQIARAMEAQHTESIVMTTGRNEILVRIQHFFGLD